MQKGLYVRTMRIGIGGGIVKLGRIVGNLGRIYEESVRNL
jgi:hypothetical protein